LILIDKLKIYKLNNLKPFKEVEFKFKINNEIQKDYVKIYNETLKVIIKKNILYELTKEGIYSFNLEIFSVFELFDFNEKDEIDINTTLKNLYKIGYQNNHPKIFHLLINFKEKNIKEHELIQYLQKEIFENKDFKNIHYTNLKEVKNNGIKYIEHYQNPNFLDFFIYKNHYLIAYDYLKLFVFDIETNNIVYLNANIGRKIKYYYIFNYNNEEYLTTLYDDIKENNETLNEILIWNEEKLKNKIEEILKTGIKIIDRQYNVSKKGK